MFVKFHAHITSDWASSNSVVIELTFLFFKEIVLPSPSSSESFASHNLIEQSHDPEQIYSSKQIFWVLTFNHDINIEVTNCFIINYHLPRRTDSDTLYSWGVSRKNLVCSKPDRVLSIFGWITLQIIKCQLLIMFLQK